MLDSESLTTGLKYRMHSLRAIYRNTTIPVTITSHSISILRVPSRANKIPQNGPVPYRPIPEQGRNYHGLYSITLYLLRLDSCRRVNSNYACYYRKRKLIVNYITVLIEIVGFYLLLQYVIS